MFETRHAVSVVTAALPNASARRVLPEIMEEADASALAWNARGTLLHDHWLRRWLPPISPAKSMLQMLVPDDSVGRLVRTIVEQARLHQQATGTVFSTPCEHAYFGSDYHVWPAREGAAAVNDSEGLTEDLNVIYCVVGHKTSDRVAKAAINAGAHGPIVYYCEGRGLRDRLGWLRITKEHEQEVLMVLADEADVEEVFDAMAVAGSLHLPGRGIMYRLNIGKGMFNLPSRVSHHLYDANMQQIINAIDHLEGHTHWRDQSVFSVGGGRGVGIESLNATRSILEDQVCLSAVATREHCPEVMDMILDAGARGVNVTYGRFTALGEGEQLAGARVNDEYGMLRCITDADTAAAIGSVVEAQAETRKLSDLCVFVNPVPAVATYVPGARDFREPPKLAVV